MSLRHCRLLTTDGIMCRPVGPGYDKGKNERLRDEVDHRYRCNYFKWTSDVKREPSASSSSSKEKKSKT